MNNIIKVYTDGGSRGNPGPSASGFVIISDEKVLHRGSTYLGKGTNNQAEYKAVIIALEWLVKNNWVMKNSYVNFFLDSELVANQLVGKYKIKDRVLKTLAIKVKSLEKEIATRVKYTAVSREKNKLADRLVNDELDAHVF
jgi:ribonuclease HI